MYDRLNPKGKSRAEVTMEHLDPCAGLKRENMTEIKEGEIRERAREVDGLGKGGDSSGRERGKQLFASPARDGIIATVSTNTGEVSNRQEAANQYSTPVPEHFAL